MSDPRRKIAILGGGVGAMAAAFGLTEQEGWQDTYDITVYQIGWRLGGKGASGRNQDANMRIEEHGLHIWGGFYENAFRVMRKCYQELGRNADAPLATWRDAFKPHSFTTVEERVGDGYSLRSRAKSKVTLSPGIFGYTSTWSARTSAASSATS